MTWFKLESIYMGRIKRIWYLWPMRAVKVQASLRICAVSPEPPLLAHTSSESRGTFRQKARSLAPLNGRACAVKTCHDRMLDNTNSLDAPHIRVDLLQWPSVFGQAVCANSVDPGQTAPTAPKGAVWTGSTLSGGGKKSLVSGNISIFFRVRR